MATPQGEEGGGGVHFPQMLHPGLIGVCYYIHV